MQPAEAVTQPALRIHGRYKYTFNPWMGIIKRLTLL